MKKYIPDFYWPGYGLQDNGLWTSNLKLMFGRGMHSVLLWKYEIGTCKEQSQFWNVQASTTATA